MSTMALPIMPKPTKPTEVMGGGDRSAMSSLDVEVWNINIVLNEKIGMYECAVNCFKYYNLKISDISNDVLTFQKVFKIII